MGPLPPMQRHLLRALALLYGLGSLFGMASLARAARAGLQQGFVQSGLSISLHWLLWAVLLAQLLWALCGSWQLWRMRASGLRALHWLSRLCVPLLVPPHATCLCGIGRYCGPPAPSRMRAMPLRWFRAFTCKWATWDGWRCATARRGKSPWA